MKRLILFLLLTFAISQVTSYLHAQPFGNEPNERKRTYDVQHIEIEVKLDLQKKTVIGRTTTSIVPLSNGFKKMEVDAVGMKIKDVELYDPKDPLDVQELNYRYNKKELNINLDRKYSTEDTIYYIVDYSIVNPVRGMYFVQPDSLHPEKKYQVWTQGEGEDNRYWFPCYDYPNDKAYIETYITVDKKYITLANGQLQSTTDNSDGTKTWHWVLNHPISSYLVMVAAGNFDIISDKWDDVPVYSYVPVGEKEEALKSFSQTPDMVKFFSDKIGFKYAWGRYSQIVVEDFIYGGMENASATVLVSSAIYDERAALDYSANSLVAHELAHQWWGDVVTCRDWSEIWLNESFATYFDDLYREHSMGEDEFYYKLLESGDLSLETDSVRHVPIFGEDRPTAFVYDKGSIVLNMLRYLTGDENFWKAMNIYITENQYKCVTTKDLIHAINQVYINPLLDLKPRDFTWFFNQWIYNAGQPEYKASYTYNDSTKEMKFTAYQIQNLDSSSVFQMPIDVRIITEKSVQDMRITPDTSMKTWTFSLDAKPLTVIFNKDNKVLCKLYFSKPESDWLYQLQNSEDAIDRITAIRGLKDFIDDEKVVDALSHTLVSDKFWGVRKEAADALSNSYLKIAADDLIESFASEKDARVRGPILSALGKIKKNCPDCYNSQSVLDFIESSIRSEISYYTVADGIRAISEIAPRDSVYDLVVNYIDSNSHADMIRRGVLEALMSSKDPRSINIFEHYAVYAGNTRLRGLAIFGLGEFLRDSSVVNLLNILLLHEKSSFLVFRILSHIEKASSPSSIPYLKKFEKKIDDEELVKRVNTIIDKINAKNSQ